MIWRIQGWYSLINYPSNNFTQKRFCGSINARTQTRWSSHHNHVPHVPVGILAPNADSPCSLISGFRNNYCRLIKITLKQVLTPLKSTVSLSLLPNRCSAIENILTGGQRKGWYKDHQLFERPQAFFREKPLHLSFFLFSFLLLLLILLLLLLILIWSNGDRRRSTRSNRWDGKKWLLLASASLSLLLFSCTHTYFV